MSGGSRGTRSAAELGSLFDGVIGGPEEIEPGSVTDGPKKMKPGSVSGGSRGARSAAELESLFDGVIGGLEEMEPGSKNLPNVGGVPLLPFFLGNVGLQHHISVGCCAHNSIRLQLGSVVA